MTVSDAVNYCRNMHNAISDSNWSDMEIYALLQAKSMEAIAFAGGLIEGKDTSTLSVIGQADYSYPSGYHRIRRVRYGNYTLKYIPFRVFEARTPTGIAPSGRPREYTMWNNVITVIPTPITAGDILTIFGEKDQSSITTSAGTLDLPVIFHPGLCDAVIGEMFAKDLNEAMSNKYSQKWMQEWLPLMKKFVLQRRRIGSPITVVDSDSSLETEFGVI